MSLREKPHTFCGRRVCGRVYVVCEGAGRCVALDMHDSAGRELAVSSAATGPCEVDIAYSYEVRILRSRDIRG